MNESTKVRKASRHNEKIGYGKNKRMNDATYALRKRVLSFVYEVRVG